MNSIQNKFISILFISFMLLSSQLFSQEIYIATNGTDSGDGSVNSPFATVEKAMEVVSISREKGNENTFTVYFREGTYAIQNTIHLNDDMSNIVLSAYQNEKVSFFGGVSIPVTKIQKTELPATKHQVQRSVYKVDLKSVGITNYGTIRNVGFARPFGPSWGEVFVNGKALHLSRWPNDGMIHIGKVLDPGSIPRNDDFSKRGGVFEYDQERISSWKTTTDIWISGYFKWGYADDAVRIAKIDTKKKTITTAQPTLYGFASDEHFRRWYAFNVLEELDENGEFFIDREKGNLYFISSEKEIKSLEFSILEDPFFLIENVSNVKIEGINFEYSRGLGIAMNNTENGVIKDCTFSNLGSLGVSIGKGIEPFTDYRHEGNGVPKSGIVGSLQQHLYGNTTFDREGGKNNKIINCKFYQLGAGGVSLGGGNRKTLESGNNTIENCIFHDLNRIEKSYRPAVHLTGVGNKIIHCEIYNTPSMAVLMHGNNHLLEYNYIHDVVLDADDQGAFYYGRDPSERGTIIRYNYFENIPDEFRTCAIYNDDGACGLIVDSNVFYKAGYWNVLLGGGSDNVYTNNIFIGTKHGIHVDNRMQNWSKGLLVKGGLVEKRLDAVNFQQPPYSSQYPELSNYWNNPALPAGNLVENNVFYNVEKLIAGKKEWLDYKKENWKTNEDLQFADFENRDFSLSSKSEVFKKLPNFKEIPFHKIGIEKTVSKRKIIESSNLSDYNVVWNTHSLNSMGSMPAGNGDIGINLWVEKNGDLLFYLSKTDAWSENGRLLKVGKVRLSLSPNPFKKGQPFFQELIVKNGFIHLEAGKNENKVSINVWVDANHPVVEIDLKSNSPISAKVTTEPWRTERRQIKSNLELHSAYGLGGEDGPDVFVEKDIVVSDSNEGVVWLHRNNRSVWEDNLKLQGLEKFINENTDPLLHRTFGGLIHSDKLEKTKANQMNSANPLTQFSVSVYSLTSQTKKKEDWISQITQKAKTIELLDRKKRFEDHMNWWQLFWEKSYINISIENIDEKEKIFNVTRNYTLQRYINACSGRGGSPIKFNGSIFTVDTENLNGEYNGFDADYRRWGGPFWWQNTRLPYWSMLEAGDFDLMQPLFKMYRDALPIRKLSTEMYYNHKGVFFPETMNFWGTYTDANYGRDRSELPLGMTENLYIKYYWQSGLEISLMMLDYYAFTKDKTFLEETLLPIVSEVINFFDQHWGRDKNGKIRFEPAMALETYRKAVNPLPEIVGIHKVCTELLKLPESEMSKSQQKQWTRLIDELPEIPTQIIDDKKMLSPAHEFSEKQNVENPELYAIFPYRTFGVGKEKLEMARNTFANRAFKQTGGWQQNAIKAAYLGLANEAAKLTSINFNTSNKAYRFPTMWGPNYDWIPDQDHGTVAMIALQRMLVQYDGEKVYLFPAWPKDWDVDFKLHAPDNTIITCSYKNGKIISLDVFPKKRQKDIVIKFDELKEKTD